MMNYDEFPMIFWGGEQDSGFWGRKGEKRVTTRNGFNGRSIIGPIVWGPGMTRSPRSAPSIFHTGTATIILI